jgi:2,3-bisphosphoglycerate-independent phosphoglycerate mutase
MQRPPLLLVVLDGWGHRQATSHNIIHSAAPYWHELLARYPHTLLSASGREVGLPLGLMGNSEVGHLNLGAGRVVYQDQTRIHKAIEDGDFFSNGALAGAMERVAKSGKTLHLMGLIGNGGVHASDVHVRAILKMAASRGLGADQVAIHAIMDGRDTAPRSGREFMTSLLADIESAGVGRVVSVIGRYFAMDRDKRWERVAKAFDLFTAGVGTRVETPLQAIEQSYAADKGDEFIEPFVIGAPDQNRMQAGDALLCFNFRSDRMREITAALGVADEPMDIDRTGWKADGLEIVTMTQYRKDFPFAVGYPPHSIQGIFPELVSAAGLRQERIAETEKYAHVTFFFSGGVEAPVPGESRTLIPSPKVATYDLQPSMSAPAITEAILASLERGETEVYVINFANADMVGHTGIEAAATLAVQTIDNCLKRIVPVVTAKGGLVAITADHGNVEMMVDEITGEPHTAHTTNPVPIVLCDEGLIGQALRPMGILADVAPTLLDVLKLDKSPGMDGVSLFRR